MTTTSTGDGEFSAVVGSYSITDDIVIAHNVTYDDHVSITGTLTVNASKTFGEGAASKNLTVSGDVTVNGTLDLDRSSSDGNATFGSLTINSGGTVQAPSHGNLTLTSESGAGYHAKNNGTFTHNNGTVKITGPTDSHAEIRGFTSSHPLNNLTLNNATGSSVETRIFGAIEIEGDLTLTDGHFDTNGQGPLDVVGDVSVASGATFDGSSSTISHGSLTIASGGTYSATSGTTTITSRTGGTGTYALENNGTFTHNNGTVAITDSDNVVSMKLGSSLYNLTLSGGTKKIRDNTTINNDLTVTSGDLYAHSTTLTLTVTGDAIISNGGSIGSTLAFTSDISFGSLEIASGGTYNATSGTTTITTGGTIGGTSDVAFGGEGTFNHNKGTLVLDSVKHRIPKGGTFYNLKLTGSHNTGGVYLFSNTMLPQAVMPDGTTDANYFAVLGTLEITNDEFRPYNADKLFVNNLIIGDGTGSSGSAKFDMSEADQFDGKMFVNNVTIHSDGKFIFGNNDETSATVGSSALNIAGSFRNLGGQVTLE